MKRHLVLALIAGLALRTLGATSPPPSKGSLAPRPSREGGRFLFVVDMSHSMKAIDPATRQAVFDLLFTGIDGYMRHGDTFGVWTFAEEVGAGKFPMQIWDGNKPLPVASRAAMFVRDQQYEGENRIEELMLKLTAVIRAVSNLNVLLITDGETDIQGTPIDDEVNAVFSRRAKERKAAKKPFITTFVVQAGHIVSGSVTLPGEPIPLPMRPEASLASAKNPQADSTNAPVAHSPNRPVPNIMISKSSTGLSNAPAPATSESQTSKPGELRITKANSAAGATNGNHAATDGQTASATGETTSPPRKVMQIITKPPSPIASVSTNDPTPTAPTTDVQAETSSPLSKTVSGTGTNAALSPAPTSDPEPAAQSSATRDLPGASASGAQVSNLRDPAAAPSSPVLPDSTKANAITAPRNPEAILAAARELAATGTARSTNEPLTIMASMPVRPRLGAIPTLIIGGILLALALFLLGVALRRMRPEPQGSLITQSMHRR